jgi:hypothetical protein
MAIVQAGKQFTSDDIQRTAGDLAALLRDGLQRGNDFRIQLESWPDADLIELGLAQEEINAIKGFFVGDLPGMSSAFAASTWVKQLLGTGV